MTESTKKRGDPREREVSSQESASEKPDLNGDWLNVILLTILYVIQGFPRGLAQAFPIILQSKKLVTYNDQAAFSVAIWAIWLNILWAPIVDSFYVQRIGRRKSWLIPIQTIMGLSFIYMAHNIDDWVPESGKPNLTMLTGLVFLLIMLAATQDVVVDGWALTMLKKKNLGYASTCNSLGVVFGLFLSSVLFIFLVSENFAHTYFRTPLGTGGLTTMKNFFYSWGIFVLVISAIVGVFKKENNHTLEDKSVRLNISQTYKLLLDTIKLPHIRILSMALLTMTAGFASMDKTVFSLKLIDAGVHKNDVIFIRSVTSGLRLCMPFFVTKYVTSSKPMSYCLNTVPVRLLSATIYGLLVYYTPSLIKRDEFDSTPMYYYFILGSVSSINEVLSIFMALTFVSFSCRLSDPNFGGTYMTFYNTLYQLGRTMSNTAALKLVSVLTFGTCSNDSDNRCSSIKLKTMCKAIGGSCKVYADGYFIIIAVCMAIGFVWYVIFNDKIRDFQSWSLSRWLPNIKRNNAATKENEFGLTPITS